VGVVRQPEARSEAAKETRRTDVAEEVAEVEVGEVAMRVAEEGEEVGGVGTMAAAVGEAVAVVVVVGVVAVAVESPKRSLLAPLSGRFLCPSQIAR
jgi:hypothetical protein